MSEDEKIKEAASALAAASMWSVEQAETAIRSVLNAYSPGPILTIDPKRQFGRVCIEGTRVPAEVVGEAVAGGDSVDDVARDYDVTREQVLLACWWYAVYVEGHGKFTKAVRAAWLGGDYEASWATRALRVLGGHDPGPLEDPPEVKR